MRPETFDAEAMMRSTRPTSPTWLWRFIRHYYGVEVPYKVVCQEQGHSAPFDYIVGSFFDTTEGWSKEEKRRYRPHKDCVVWAARGSGKTVCGAIATHLDCIFRPGCETRILAGSEDQARKMYKYKTDLDNLSFSDLVKGEPKRRETLYLNNSAVEILTQSQKSVRGTHVQRLRLDEVEEFKHDVYEAAQYVPQEQRGIPASLEQFSTLHHQHGLMSELVESAGEPGSSVTLYKWCCFCVIEHCPLRCTPEKPHEKCASLVRYDNTNTPHTFAEVCGGRAKRGTGYYRIEDLRRTFMRVSYESFCAEMLCERPQRSDAIYPMLDERYHVLNQDWYDPQSPLFIAFDAGYHHPFALWFQIWEGETVVFVHEYAPESIAISDFINGVVREHEKRGFKKAEGGFCDPSGRELIVDLNKSDARGHLFVGNSNYTPRGNVNRSDNRLIAGYEAVRKRLSLYQDGDGKTRTKLCFAPCCKVSFRQMRKLHYSRGNDGEYTEEQEKIDDHGADCVRYAVRGHEWWRALEKEGRLEPPRMVVMSSG